MPCMLDQDRNLENLIQMLQHLQSSKHPCPWRFSDILVEFCDVADKCTCPLSNLYIDTSTHSISHPRDFWIFDYFLKGLSSLWIKHNPGVDKL